MSERIQKQKTSTETKQTTEEVKAKDQGEQLKNELDELLDEIDEVLEENAEEFVKGYIQKGGQMVRTFWKTVKDGVIAVHGNPTLLKVWN